MDSELCVVYHSISSSNHNSGYVDNAPISLYIILFHHQTTTRRSCNPSTSWLYIILFHHQTTTSSCIADGGRQLYIILFHHQTTTDSRSRTRTSKLYIILFHHQTTTDTDKVALVASCISFYFIIKPQLGCGKLEVGKVVYHSISSSNHNLYLSGLA